MKLSLVVPCYNEEDNVRAFYEAVHTAFAGCGYSYELVMVNDGSRDKTLPRLKELYEEKKNEANLTIISFSRNFGKEAAILAGMRRAKGDLVCLIDADLQQRPEIVREMVEILDEHEEYDCVAAFQEERNEGAVLNFFKNGFYWLINKMTDVKFMRGASDFRTCRRNMVEAILSLPEYHRFSKGIFAWVGFETKFIPYHAEERNAGTSKWSFFKLVRYAIDGIIAFSTSPLRIATITGALFSSLSMIYLIIVVLQKLISGNEVPGYPTLVVLILLIGGIQMLMLGIVGEYIARIYMQDKNRPVYIEKEVITTSEEGSPERSEKLCGDEAKGV